MLGIPILFKEYALIEWHGLLGAARRLCWASAALDCRLRASQLSGFQEFLWAPSMGP